MFAFGYGNPDWRFAGIYADEGITGTKAEKRPEFQRLMRDCKKRKIDMILTKSVARFARNTVDSLSYVRRLKAQGIGVFFEEQNLDSMKADSEMFIGIHSVLAQAESENISANVRWGIQQRISHLYFCYQKDTNEEEKKKEIAKKIVILHLSMYNLFYKSEAYKEEREIRLICNINPELKEWSSIEDPNTSLYFEKDCLFLRLKGNCYRQSLRELDVYNSIELNKSIFTSEEIRDTLKKRKETRTDNGSNNA